MKKKELVEHFSEVSGINIETVRNNYKRGPMFINYYKNLYYYKDILKLDKSMYELPKENNRFINTFDNYNNETLVDIDMREEMVHVFISKYYNIEKENGIKVLSKFTNSKPHIKNVDYNKIIRYLINPDVLIDKDVNDLFRYYCPGFLYAVYTTKDNIEYQYYSILDEVKKYITGQYNKGEIIINENGFKVPHSLKDKIYDRILFKLKEMGYGLISSIHNRGGEW